MRHTLLLDTNVFVLHHGHDECQLLVVVCIWMIVLLYFDVIFPVYKANY